MTLRKGPIFPPDTWLLFAAVTALDFAGVLARCMVSPKGAGLALLLGVMLLPPLLLVVGLCTRHPQRSVRWGAALAAAALAGWCMFTISEPSVNQDANFGIGFYLMFGVFPLSLAALLGGLAGRAFDAVRGVNAPVSTADKAPRPPLRPWLWPALWLLPAALLAAWLEWADMQAVLQEIGRTPAFLSPWEEVPTFIFVKLLTLAPFALLPALWLRYLAMQGRPRRALGAWWGVCVGLALGLLTRQTWLSAFGLLCFPVVGAVVAWYVTPAAGTGVRN